MSDHTQANRFTVSDELWEQVKPLIPKHQNPDPLR